MGSQNYDPVLVPLKTRCRNLIYNPKGPITLRITHFVTSPTGLGGRSSGFRDVVFRIQVDHWSLRPHKGCGPALHITLGFGHC